MQEVKGIVTTLMYSEIKMAQQNLQNSRCVRPHQQWLNRPADKVPYILSLTQLTEHNC